MQISIFQNDMMNLCAFRNVTVYWGLSEQKYIAG